MTLPQLQQKLEEKHLLTKNERCERDFDGKCQHIHSMNDALAFAFQAGKNAAVEYIEKTWPTEAFLPERKEFWERTLTEARNAE